MRYDPEKQHRRSIRLRGYDYTQAGAYFVTICVRPRGNILGEVRDGEMTLNEAGRTAQTGWLELDRRFVGLTLDAFVIMPDHLHGLLLLGESRLEAPSSRPALGQIVRVFKALTARQIRQLGIEFTWQRNYYERIVRHDGELDRVREYIAGNPAKWETEPGHAVFHPPDL